MRTLPSEYVTESRSLFSGLPKGEGFSITSHDTIAFFCIKSYLRTALIVFVGF
jgi:hypothetical protein